MLVELDADVALDPRERVVLSDREDHGVARNGHGAGDLALLLAVLLGPLELLKLHADERAVLVDEALGRVVLDDRDLLLLGVLEFPR